MGLLVDGVWQEQQHSERTTAGRFMRPTTRFRNWVTEDGSPGPSGAPGDISAASCGYRRGSGRACDGHVRASC